MAVVLIALAKVTRLVKLTGSTVMNILWHDDVIKWKHFPRYWPFVRGIHRSPVNSLRGIHRSPVNSPHKGQSSRALVFSLICVWIKGWVNNREAGDLRRYRAHYDVTVMGTSLSIQVLFLGAAISNSNWRFDMHKDRRLRLIIIFIIIHFLLNWN